jgi:hypothetical protein
LCTARRTGPFYTAAQFQPPFPPKGTESFTVWTPEHRGHQLCFASLEETAHVAGVLGQRLMTRPRGLGAGQPAVNSHWLSGADKASLSRKARREIVSKLTDELGRPERRSNA